MSDTLRARLQSTLGAAYELQDELTGGGMSRVFVARDVALGRTVVVKVLPPDLAAGVNRERFTREVQLAAQLQHPHIVPLLSAGEVPGEPGLAPSAPGGMPCPFYTMPYIDGESLRLVLERRGPLPVRDVLRILADVAEALAYAHSRGVIHRDIKPANILMQGSHALVTDFGVAKAISAALPQAGTTTTGVAIGTPAYMAPEQLAADPAADHRVDLYALGLVGYEALTGASPFASASPQETMAAQLTRSPAPLRQSRADVPEALDLLLRRLLEKGAERRPADAAAVVAALEAIPVPSGGTVRLAAGGRPARPAARAWPWLAGGLAIGAAAVLFALRPDGAAAPPPGPTDTAPATALADSAPSISVSAPAPAPAAAPRALTREDSLLIAAAILERQQRARAERPREDADSVREEIRRTLADSIARALGASRSVVYAFSDDQRQALSDSLVRRFTQLADSFGRLPEGSRMVLRGRDGAIDTVMLPGFPPPRTPRTPRTGVSVTPAAPPAPPPPGMRRVLVGWPASQARGEGGLLRLALRDSLVAALRRTGAWEVVGPEFIAEAPPTGMSRGERLAYLGIAASVGGRVELGGGFVTVTLVVEPADGAVRRVLPTQNAPAGEAGALFGRMAAELVARLAEGR